MEDTEARQRKRAANQEAGDKAEQVKNTGARQRKRAANQETGDKAGQVKDTKARQLPSWGASATRNRSPPRALRAYFDFAGEHRAPGCHEKRQRREINRLRRLLEHQGEAEEAFGEPRGR